MIFTLSVLLSAFLLRFGGASLVGDDSLFADEPINLNDDALSTFDSSSLIADNADLDSNLFYDDSSALSDLNLPLPALDLAHFDSSNSVEFDYLDNDDALLIAAADENVIGSNDFCLNLNPGGGQSRKRAIQCRPADAPASALEIPTLPNLAPSDNNPEPPPEEGIDELKAPLRRLYEGTDEDKCSVHGILPFIGRTVEVCCAERGAYVMDKWARLIYNDLFNCERSLYTYCIEPRPINACCRLLLAGKGIDCIEVGDRPVDGYRNFRHFKGD